MLNYVNAFPGYEFKRLEGELDDGKMHNMYRDVDLGKGGWVYSDPGIYTNVALLDVASMHPASIIALNKLGKYTQRYADLRQARVYIKHGDFESAGKLFDGKLKKYLTNPDAATELSAALKLPLNSFFGISFASYSNPARDSRDKNNIIALRGALFMKTLFDEIEARGFHVIHNKTDSCKIPNATLDIVHFVQDFARKYGYEMEHEATYDRICLIDDAQYVASYMDIKKCEELYGYVPSDNRKHFAKNSHPWTVTGKCFMRPCVFKTLFSGEPISFEDRCETKTVKDAVIYLDMNEKLPDVRLYEKEYERRLANSKDSSKKFRLNPDMSSLSDDEIAKKISEGHSYKFVGRVGSFYPIRPGLGGGLLVVNRNNKYDSVSGSKGFRWLEAEVVKALGKEDDVDYAYYQKQIDESIEFINKFGSFDSFIDTSRTYEDDESRKARDISTDFDDDDPPWSDLPSVVPCGDGKYNNCMECPNCDGDLCSSGYSLAVQNGG